MGMLDFIRNRRRPESVDADLDPKAHGHATWKGVFDEIRADEALAKVRKESGREPQSGLDQHSRKAKPSWER